jgi:hypothetical protein
MGQGTLTKMEQNPDVKNMVDYLLNRSTSYKKEKIVEDYLRSLKQFLKCVQKEPSEILDEADLDEKLSRRERKHPLKAYLYQYLNYLRTTNLTHKKTTHLNQLVSQ